MYNTYIHTYIHVISPILICNTEQVWHCIVIQVLRQDKAEKYVQKMSNGQPAFTWATRFLTLTANQLLIGLEEEELEVWARSE